MTVSGEARVTLEDGRHLDIYRSGPEDARVLLFHHGTPGSRAPFRDIENAAHRHGFQLVTLSRPGYGSSTRQPGRSVADVVADTVQVLDAVGADRCVVAGWSGGGPHALACGARLAGRVDGVLVMAGVGPYGFEDLDFMNGMGEGNIVEFGKAIEGEAALRPFLEEEREQMLQATPSQLVEAMGSLLPPVDKAQLTGELGEDLMANFHEALRLGVDGWLDDDLAFARPWGFDLSEVSVPTFLWQGSEDLMVPFDHGQWLAEQIPGVTAHLEPGEGHVSVVIGALDRMFSELAGVTCS
ncbi:MAG TPA: alpha/beta hydrolase [Chloroflexota bacterium]|nr:alpha/beta hydrolase [Chloroflexota bacterium]